jgi:peptidoglycan/LPS O-acetylase OafA/YrhL
VLAGLLAVLPATAAAAAAGAARGRATLAGAARMSYALLLIHYPVLLLVGAIVGSLWPESAPAHAVGLVAAWGLSVAAGVALHHTVEKRGLFARRQSALMYRTPDQRFGWSQRGT